MEPIFHYIFSTYKRKHILSEEIAELLERIFTQICEKKGFKLICQSILLDHVHLLIMRSGAFRNEYVMKVLKGSSAHKIFETFPVNRLEFRKLWGRGYRAVRVRGDDQLARAISYIKGQKINGVDKRIKLIGSRDVQSLASNG